MKVEFLENEYGIYVTLLPENIEEMSSLLRYSKNVAKVKPNVIFSFSREPYLQLHLTKYKLSVQENYIDSDK